MQTIWLPQINKCTLFYLFFVCFFLCKNAIPLFLWLVAFLRIELKFTKITLACHNSEQRSVGIWVGFEFYFFVYFIPQTEAMCVLNVSQMMDFPPAAEHIHSLWRNMERSWCVKCCCRFLNISAVRRFLCCKQAVHHVQITAGQCSPCAATFHTCPTLLI